MKHSGFTLLETIIYCALFSVLMTSAIVTVYALIDSNEKTENQTNSIAEAIFINEKLTWAFSNATAVEIIDAQTMRIIRPDLVSQSPLIIVFKNNTLYLSRGSAEAHALVAPQYNVGLQTITFDDPRLTITYSLNNNDFIFTTFIK